MSFLKRMISLFSPPFHYGFVVEFYVFSFFPGNFSFFLWSFSVLIIPFYRSFFVFVILSAVNFTMLSKFSLNYNKKSTFNAIYNLFIPSIPV